LGEEIDVQIFLRNSLSLKQLFLKYFSFNIQNSADYSGKPFKKRFAGKLEFDKTLTFDKVTAGKAGLQNLFDADVIVSGGQGATSEGLRLVKELAEAFKAAGVNAEWACSRIVVDEGYAEYACQIGQIGKTVRPQSIYPCTSFTHFQIV
jgi:electron transfer flavoprotein alpha subunit